MSNPSMFTALTSPYLALCGREAFTGTLGESTSYCLQKKGTWLEIVNLCNFRVIEKEKNLILLLIDMPTTNLC